MADRVVSDNHEPEEAHGEKTLDGGGVYDPLQHGNRSCFRKLFTQPEVPFIVVGGVLIVLIIAFVIYAPRDKTDDIAQRIVGIERKLVALEKRVAGLPAVEVTADRLEKQASVCERFSDRFESVEAALTRRVDRIANDLDRLKKNNSRLAIRHPSPAMSKKTGRAKKESVFHLVRSGETLYRISQEYGVTISVIQKLNRLTNNDAIYPGQKLLVKETASLKR